MSLDVYLYGAETAVPCHCYRCGNLHERRGREEIFEASITHNLTAMAGEAGIYKAIWRPDEIGITKAGQLRELLKDGLAALKSNPARFKKFNPKNGCGNYEDLVRFVDQYLAACVESPEATIDVSRIPI